MAVRTKEAASQAQAAFAIRSSGALLFRKLVGTSILCPT
jgi:hypothetical protein